MAINFLQHINAAEHEFSGEEIGEMLLESVRQSKAGKRGRIYSPSETAQARLNTGMTQQEFAGIMGVSVRTLQNWEQGRRKPSGAAATLLKIAARHPETLRELLTS